MSQPNNIYFTWLDVEDRLFESLISSDQTQEDEKIKYRLQAIDGLRFFVYPDGVDVFLTKNEDQEKIIEILQEIFSFGVFDGDKFSLEGNRTLPISFQIEEDELESEGKIIPKLLPLLSRPNFLTPILQYARPEEKTLPVVAFHSFKGGVGRTTTALLTMAKLIRQRMKVLFVDLDLEAPGASLLIKGTPVVSISDFMGLIQQEDVDKAVDIVSHRVKGSPFTSDGRNFILPAFRTKQQKLVVGVRPENIARSHYGENPFILTDALVALGEKLDVDIILVDLRAGLTDISTTILSDSRILRVLVTAQSYQSIEGTKDVIKFLTQRTSVTPENLLIMISQIRVDLDQPDFIVSDLNQHILDAINEPIHSSIEEHKRSVITENVTKFIGLVPYAETLRIQTSNWEYYLRDEQQIDLTELIERIQDVISSVKNERRAENENSDGYSFNQSEKLMDIQSKRHAFLEILTPYAEGNDSRGFLAIEPLKRLIYGVDNRLYPAFIVEGAKGAGKTFSFMQMVRAQTWENFAKEAGVVNSERKAAILPLVMPKNVRASAEKEIEELNPNMQKSFLPDILLGENPANWIEVWFEFFCRSFGYSVKQQGNSWESTFVTRMRENNTESYIGIIDGLEEIFTNRDENTRKALQTLLLEVSYRIPRNLQNFALIIFIRRDLVDHAVQTNLGQFRERYLDYVLNWDNKTVLQLVAWLASKAEIIIDSPDQVIKLNDDDINARLEEIWGKYLGNSAKSGRSKEWILAALSDFNGSIQARDIVFFLREAVNLELNTSIQRLISERSIRSALLKLGREKTNWVTEENDRLRDIFDLINRKFSGEKSVPIPTKTMDSNLEEVDIQYLIDMGILLHIPDGANPGYYLPLLYMYGLMFEQSTRGRYRIIDLLERAKRRTRLP